MRMPRGRNLVILALVLVVILAAIVVLVLISRQSETTDLFSSQLDKVDMLIQEGKQDNALRKLSRLRNKAVTVRDFLSIAKREMNLQAPESALTTLESGSLSFPVNQELNALTVYILMNLHRYQEAEQKSNSLLSGSWKSLAAAAALSASVDPLTVSSAIYRAAAESTGYPFYYRNAIVTAACSGDLGQAFMLFKEWRYRLPDDVLLGIYLSFDNRQWTFLLELAESELRYDTRVFLAAAHAAYLLRETSRAISLWDTIIQHDTEDVLALYNRAFTSDDFALKKSLLQKALNLNPGFWPALNQYISLFFAHGNSPESLSPVTAYLKEIGWETLEMERRRGYARITDEEILSAIEKALVSATSQEIGRIQIEALRFPLGKGSETLRTAGKIWNLLERYPTDPDILEYGLWYFLVSGDPDTAAFLFGRLLSYSSSRPWVTDFYDGILLTLQGRYEDALSRFASLASDSRNAWRALANSARIYQIQGNTSAAIDSFSLAAELASENHSKSILYYEAARIIADAREQQRAAVIAGYAVELDPENYKAVSLVKELNFR